MSKFHNGVFIPQNPTKYKGTVPIIWRSRWELRFMLWVDSNPNIIQWASESTPIPYFNPVKSRIARYFPDFYMEIKDKEGKVSRWIIEIKPSNQSSAPVAKPNQKTKTKIYNQINWLVNEAKWKAAEEFCKLNGLKFKVLTEKELFNK